MRRLGAVLGTAVVTALCLFPVTAMGERLPTDTGEIEIFDGYSDRLGGFGEAITFEFRGRCSDHAKIEIGPAFNYHASNICGWESTPWDGHNGIRPLWIAESKYREHGGIGAGKKGLILTVGVLGQPPTFERTFPIRIHFDGQLVRRFLEVSIETHEAKVVWEGTDAFINVCIDGSLELRSRGGRLYCETRGTQYSELRLQRHR